MMISPTNSVVYKVDHTFESLKHTELVKLNQAYLLTMVTLKT